MPIETHGDEKDHNPPGMTRRQLLKAGLIFSAAALTPGWLRGAAAQPSLNRFAEGGIHLLAVGDIGTGNENQVAVAQQMAAFASKLNAPLSSVIALGDNFYGQLKPERFDRHFEQMYPRKSLDVPFYPCLGNHDYGTAIYDFQEGKAQMQLDYARNHPDSRWKFPSKWYTVDLPSPRNPLVRLIVLDLNYWPGALTPQEKLDVERFFAAEYQREPRAQWTWLINHYPLYSNSERGNDNFLLERWGPIIKQYPVSFHLAGHDHTMQHLEVEGFNTSFIVSGAGGAGLYEIRRKDHALYGARILGFNHFHITPEWVDTQFIDKDGNRLHSFRRYQNGKVEVTTQAQATTQTQATTEAPALAPRA